MSSEAGQSLLTTICCGLGLPGEGVRWRAAPTTSWDGMRKTRVLGEHQKVLLNGLFPELVSAFN